MNFHPRSVLRTPLLPYSATITEGFDTYLNDARVQEAIYIASPVLYDELQKYLAGELKDTKKVHKLKVSLQKYLRRITSRATPFGLFATCGTVGSAANMALTIVAPSAARVHTRFDMYYLNALANHLGKVPAIRESLMYRPNSSLYLKYNNYRYVEYLYQGDKRVHKMSEVECSDYLTFILSNCLQGAMLPQIARTFVLQFEEYSLEEINDFLNTLIDNQLLVSELEPNISGEEYFETIIETLENAAQRVGQKLPFTETLQSLHQKVKHLDTLPPNERIKGYEHIIGILEQMPIKFDKSKLFQVDTFKDNDAETVHLSNDVQKEVEEAIVFLKRFNAPSSNSNLQAFRQALMTRYEVRDMPLLEVLDVETGVGYPLKESQESSELLGGLAIPQPPAKVQNRSNITWGDYERFFFALYNKALQEGKTVIDLSKENVPDFTERSKTPIDSATITMMYSVVGTTAEGKTLIDFISAGTSSPSNLLGRFAHASKEMYDMVMATTAKEEAYQVDKIMAEIIHVPEDRVGNVLVHPTFLRYEIPYLGKSSVAEEFQIRLDDLYVSIKGNKLALKSKRLGKEIKPRLSNAHNRQLSPQPAYRLLCDLENEGKPGGFGFSWGSLTTIYSHFPRVMYKNIILSKASWALKKEDFEVLVKTEKNETTVLSITKTWQEKYKLPNQVLLVEGDNELLIELTDEFSVLMFIDSIKKKPSIHLVEFVFDAKTCPIQDAEGKTYINQFISVITNEPKEKEISEKPTETLTNKEEILENTNVKRYFEVGSEWVYYKFYCGMQTSERLLKEAIPPCIEILKAKGWIDQWFFIRFRDSDNHFRIRFHLTDLKYLGVVQQTIHQHTATWFEEGFVWKTQTDTYQREIDRYGSATIDVSEQIFCADSENYLDFCQLLEEDSDEHLRWKYILLKINAYM
ncbi:MAG: hypothetical protein RLZZ292_2351, partial [Bacteroidota bacterium]